MAEANPQLRPKSVLITDANGVNTANVNEQGQLEVDATFGGTIVVGGVGMIGSPIPTQAMLMGGEDPDGNLQPIQLNTDGSLVVGADGGTF